MKKSVIIVIGIIFVASIFVINLFGLKMSVYKEVFPVERIECLNTAGDGVKISSLLYPVNGAATPVSEWQRIKVIEVVYADLDATEEGDSKMFFIQTRVYPDNATEKHLNYLNYSSTKGVEFYVDGSGNQNGLVLFSNKCAVIIKISTAEKNNPASLFIMIKVK